MSTGLFVASPLPRKQLRALSPERSFWYDIGEDEFPVGDADAIVLPDWLPAFNFDEFSDGISQASTSAGPSPSLEQMLSPLPSKSLTLTPEHRINLCSDLDKSLDTSLATPSEETSSPEKAKWAQIRKIFVGGIPQSMDQNSLYKLFSKTGKVKKAWLQMFHADSPEGQGPIKKHRGFGFVIFAEKEAVDQLLGDEFSKVIYFGDGVRLEVKRAVGKTGSLTTPENIPKTPGLVSQGSRDNTPPILELSTALQDQPLQISLATVFKDLPNVPPFPCAQSAPVPWQCQTTWAVAIPVQQVQPHPRPSLHGSISKQVPSILLDGYVGCKPRNEHELEMVLRNAMPDCYDD
jgi:hypothetical protein